MRVWGYVVFALVLAFAWHLQSQAAIVPTNANSAPSASAYTVPARPLVLASAAGAVLSDTDSTPPNDSADDPFAAFGPASQWFYEAADYEGLDGVSAPLRAPYSDSTPEGEKAYAWFKDAFTEAMRADGVPGGAFVVLEDGRPVLTVSYGVRDLRTKSAVTSDTAFPLSSVSKTFAGTLAGLLTEGGILDLSEPVRTFVPDFKVGRGKHADGVLLRHVLSHSAGVVPNAYDNLLEAGRPFEEIVPRFGKVNPMCAPGKCYGYQNIIFSFIKPAIESRTGQTYQALMQEKILGPLGMTNSGVGYDAFTARENRAAPHLKVRGTWRGTRLKPYYLGLEPASGMSASISDLGRWVGAHMGDRPDVLPSWLRTLITEQETKTTRERYRRFWRGHVQDAAYGLGWRLYDFDGADLVYHGGAIQGFRSSVAYAPEEGVGIAMLANGDTRVLDQLGAEFWTRVLKEKAKARMRADASTALVTGKASVANTSKATAERPVAAR